MKLLRSILLVGWAALLVSCDGGPTDPVDRIVAGIDFAELFAPPLASEVSAILAEWETRDTSSQNVVVEAESTISTGIDQATLRIISHTVGGARHFGAVLVPQGAEAGSLPVLMFLHPGDGGLDIDEALPLLPLLLGGDLGRFVFVAPAFRSEAIRSEEMLFQSEGDPSPWDFDVDDALALLNVVRETTPEADGERVATLGFSRGATVAMLMAARDPRIDSIVAFHGPTDFMGPFAQEIIEEALLGAPRDLAGLETLDNRFLQPLRRSELSIADVRLELVRRSPVYFAERLPDLQVHHGTADDVVPVSEAERLAEVMHGLGRVEPEFEVFLYEGGTHTPLSLGGSIERARSFISRLLSLSAAVGAEWVGRR